MLIFLQTTKRCLSWSPASIFPEQSVWLDFRASSSSQGASKNFLWQELPCILVRKIEFWSSKYYFWEFFAEMMWRNWVLSTGALMGTRWCLKLDEGKSIHADGYNSHRSKSHQGLVTSPGLPKAAPLWADPGTKHWQLTGRKGAMARDQQVTTLLSPDHMTFQIQIWFPLLMGRALVQVWGSLPSAQDSLWGCTVLVVLMILKGYLE